MAKEGSARENALIRRDEVRSDRLARYERMVEIRTLEDRVLELYQEGHIAGSTHTCHGQEAVAVGIAAATRPSDTVACTYRGHGMALALGMTFEAILGEIAGRTIGCIGGLGGSMHLSDPSLGLLPTFAIVGAGIPVAAGAALAAQVQGTDDVAVAVFGDGATNIGAFHEGLNLAAVWRLPVLFVIENNLYGEYSRIDKTTLIVDLADRAASYGLPSEIVDGQELDEVVSAVGKAVARARQGSGPSLLEMKTYRFAGHSRGDAATYRPPGELEAWQERDPLQLFAERLTSEGLADADVLRAIEHGAHDAVDAAVSRVLSSPPPSERAMFNNVLANSGQG